MEILIFDDCMADPKPWSPWMQAFFARIVRQDVQVGRAKPEKERSV